MSEVGSRNVAGLVVLRVTRSREAMGVRGGVDEQRVGLTVATVAAAKAQAAVEEQLGRR